MDGMKARLLIEEFRQHMAAFGEKHEVVVDVGTAKYADTFLKIAVELAEITPDGQIQSEDARTFVARAKLYGLQPTDLNREFLHRGRKFKVTGAGRKNSRCPILCKEVGTNGVLTAFSEHVVKQCLENTNV